MTHSKDIAKEEVLEQIDSAKELTQKDRDEYRAKMDSEVNIANRAFYQGQYVAMQVMLNRLISMRNLFENW